MTYLLGLISTSSNPAANTLFPAEKIRAQTIFHFMGQTIDETCEVVNNVSYVNHLSMMQPLWLAGSSPNNYLVVEKRGFWNVIEVICTLERGNECVSLINFCSIRVLYLMAFDLKWFLFESLFTNFVIICCCRWETSLLIGVRLRMVFSPDNSTFMIRVP